jgi:PRTRC genetic system protein A
MLPNPVAYLTHSNGKEPQTPAGKAYSYILAGNGVFKHARSRFVEVCVPLVGVQVAGLKPLAGFVRPRYALPAEVLQLILADARRRSWGEPKEEMYHVLLGEDRRVQIVHPEQSGGAATLRYSGGDDERIVVDVHSHHQMGAFFSSTDDQDEQGFRFYAVIGRIFTSPQIALRVGVYGDFYPLPVERLFSGHSPLVSVLGVGNGD